MQFVKKQLKRSRTIERMALKRYAYKDRELNFYFLSTGHCGTKFYAQVLATATNAVVYHEPPPGLPDVMRAVVARYVADRNEFDKLRISDFRKLEDKLLWQAMIPSAVYGDTLNNMFAYGYMYYKYFGREKLRLVHLIRNPIACGRSILKVERENGGSNFVSRSEQLLDGNTSAEKTGHLWNHINNIIQYQFELINDPEICKVIRLEDLSVDTIRELFDFLRLEGFDESKIRTLLEDDSPETRHSHMALRTELKDATQEELDTIARITQSVAARYGY